MSIYRIVGAAAALAVLASPAMAQQVVYEPGYCAFFYPNANCNNYGPGNPYTGDYQRRLTQGASMPGSDRSAGVVKQRATKPRRVQ